MRRSPNLSGEAATTRSGLGKPVISTGWNALVGRRVQHWELLVPAGLTDPASARVAIYGRRPHPEQVHDERPRDLLPQHETVRFLGQYDHVPPLEESARHPDVVRHVLSEFGWFGVKYDVYRSRVAYPVLHTLLCVRVDAVRRT